MDDVRVNRCRVLGMGGGEDRTAAEETVRRAWAALVDWFEHGDLIPLLILVSAVHYAVILATVDYWAVAVAIGLLVDLGHYRTIRAAIRYTGDNKRQAISRWGIVAVMTAISLSYHQRYYDDWLLSVPIPLLIAALAWLAKVDAVRVRIHPKPQVDDPTPIMDDAQPVLHDATVMQPHPNGKIYTCEICNAEFDDRWIYASHKRWGHKN